MKGYITVSTGIGSLWKELKQKGKPSKPTMLFDTSFQTFDDATLCMAPGDVTVIHSPRSEVQTHFALNILHRVAVDRKVLREGNKRETPIGGVPSSLYTFKSSSEELLKQLVCIEGKISRNDLDHLIPDNKSKTLEVAKKALTKSTLTISAPGLFTTPDELFKDRKAGPGLIVIDSFDLLEFKDSVKGRLTALGEIKECAVRLGVHVIVCLDLVRIGQDAPERVRTDNAWVQTMADNVFCLSSGTSSQSAKVVSLEVVKSRANIFFTEYLFHYFRESGLMIDSDEFHDDNDRS